MLAATASSLSLPTLGEPSTSQGHALLELLAPQLGPIADSADGNDRKARFPYEAFQGFRSSGVMAATVPAELGGLGVANLGDVATALARVARADASTALALHVQFSRGLTLAYEWQHGTATVQRLAERLLRQMATGDATVCGAVKDAPSITTWLVSDGADGWLMTGRKTLVTMAPIATHFVSYARQLVDQQEFLVAPVLSRNTPGLTVFEHWDGVGMRASGTVDIAFDNCPVSRDQILIRGNLHSHSDASLAGQTVSSISMLGIYAGIAEAARQLAVNRATQRAPSAAVRTLITGIDANLYALEATAAAAIATADALSVDLRADPGERGRKMMVPFQYAKLKVNQLCQEIVNDCMTIVGGEAYSGMHALGRLYRDVRAGWFMQPLTYSDSVEFLSGHALNLVQADDYMKVKPSQEGVI